MTAPLSGELRVCSNLACMRRLPASQMIRKATAAKHHRFICPECDRRAKLQTHAAEHAARRAARAA